jgi:hypothetical protein
LKAYLDSHAIKHQENKFKILLKRKIICWETTRAQHMYVLAKVEAFLFWKKYQPRAPNVGKISVATLLKGFRKLVGQSPPRIRLQVNHLA